MMCRTSGKKAGFGARIPRRPLVVLFHRLSSFLHKRTAAHLRPVDKDGPLLVCAAPNGVHRRVFAPRDVLISVEYQGSYSSAYFHLYPPARFL